MLLASVAFRYLPAVSWSSMSFSISLCPSIARKQVSPVLQLAVQSVQIHLHPAVAD